MNVDGILYLNMAEAYVAGGLSSASQLYDWPFFSILIGLVSQYSWLDLQSSAILINTLLFVILTDSLLLISNEGLSSSSQTVISAFVILCFYTLNEYRDFIIRDVGYWAMSALAIFHYLKFFKHGNKNRLILWVVFGLIAVMFRIEGLILLALMPIAILFSERPKKLHAITLSYLPLLIMATVLAAVILDDSTLWGAFAKISDYERYFYPEKLIAAFWQDEEIIANQVIHPIAKDQALTLLVSGLLGLVLYDVFTGLSISVLALFALSFRVQPKVDKNYKLVIGSFVVINLLILFSFTFSKHFISTRYCMLAILGIVLLMMPKITTYFESCINQRQHFKASLIVLLLSLSLVDTFHKTSSKMYIIDAIQWTAQNTAPESSIYTNSKHVAFYLAHDYGHANVTVNDRRLTMCDYDYAVIVERYLTQRIRKTLEKCNWQLQNIFEEDGRTVKIYSPTQNE